MTWFRFKPMCRVTSKGVGMPARVLCTVCVACIDVEGIFSLLADLYGVVVRYVDTRAGNWQPLAIWLQQCASFV